MEKNWSVGTVYLNDRTRIIVMGITGREASQVVAESEALYPGFIVAGVTPGKGGSEVAGKPVYNTVREALGKHPEINTAIVYVPPASVKDAVIELVDAGIKLIYIITEHVPIRDTVYFYHYAKERGVIIVGPTSLGCMMPWIPARIGAIGGKNPSIAYEKGGLVILSKSGGLTTTTAEMFKRRGWGVYMALALGGDVISCTTFADALENIADDPNVKGVIIQGEVGGSYEEQSAETILRLWKEGRWNKPVAAFVAGRFQEKLEGVSFGHAGAIVERGKGKATDKIRAFNEVGKITGLVKVADFYHDLVHCIEELGVPRDFEDTSPEGRVKPLYSTIDEKTCKFIG
ncbi:MAG: CoA-binding protein [Aquificaceae bacterium]|nr:CoA-binding protein [Aquificaceae bacterium]MDW8066225.1 CoA-binding protein [Aquificaceae bacterium]MDW8423786.1 CoA-binding protein [Aquificaceae bacterium]